MSSRRQPFPRAHGISCRAIAAHGIAAPKGPAGSILFFDGNVVHGSAPNLSPFNRMLALVTYNAVSNTPPLREKPRPKFLCSRDFTPIAPLESGTHASALPLSSV